MALALSLQCEHSINSNIVLRLDFESGPKDLVLNLSWLKHSESEDFGGSRGPGPFANCAQLLIQTWIKTLYLYKLFVCYLKWPLGGINSPVFILQQPVWLFFCWFQVFHEISVAFSTINMFIKFIKFQYYK